MAGCSAGNIRHQFGSKRELYRVCMASIARTFREHSQPAIDAGDICGFTRSFDHVICRNPELTAMWMRASLSGDPDERESATHDVFLPVWGAFLDLLEATSSDTPENRAIMLQWIGGRVLARVLLCEEGVNRALDHPVAGDMSLEVSLLGLKHQSANIEETLAATRTPQSSTLGGT